MSTIAIPVHARNINPGLNQFCQSWWTCEFASALSEAWLLLAAGILALVLLAMLPNLRAASNRIEEEQSRTAAERDAFKSFAKSISELSPESVPATVGTDGAAVTTATTVANRPQQLAKVREAYRQTVMAVPHYDEEYGESLEQNVAIEFGEDIAASIGGNQRLSPMLRQALISKAMGAAEERNRLLGWLSEETEEINSARKTLAEVESELSEYSAGALDGVELGGLGDRYNRLDELENRCRGVTQTRQRTIHKHQGERPQAEQGFIEYVYDPLQVEYPVLADVTAVLERIENARMRVTRAVTRRA